MDKKLKVIILGGKRGLIGEALSHVWKRDPAIELIVHGKEDFDVLKFDELKEYLNEHHPDVVVNSVDFNLIDLAEDLPDNAFKLNQTLPQKLVEFLRDKDVYLINFSTSMVFDGKKHFPYQEEDEINPLGVYGKSKFLGERAIIQGNLKRWLIIRISWLFGPWGPNFVQHIINLSEDKHKISAVHDQIGSPTYTLDLAIFILNLVKKGASGIFHACNSGQATFCELAQETISLLGRNCRVEPITSEMYTQKAPRPMFEVLDNSKYVEVTGHKPRSWMLALRDYIFSFYSDSVMD